MSAKLALEPNRWSILAVLFFARASMGLQFQAIASAGPSLQTDLGLGPEQVGSLIGLYMVPGLFIALPGGWMARRSGEKRTCLLGLALMISGGCLQGSAATFPVLAAARVVSGSGAVIMNLVLTSMAADWFAGFEMVTAISILVASWPASIAAGLIGGTALSLYCGWKTVMYAAAAFCMAAWIGVAILYSGRRSASVSSGDAASAMSRQEMLSCCLAGILWGSFNAGLVIFYSFTPQLLSELGWQAVAAASVTSLGLWVTIASLPLGGWIVEAWRCPDTGIVVSCSAAATVMIALSLAPASTLSVALGLAVGLGGGAIMGLPSRLVATKNRAFGFGLFYTAYFAVMAVGPGLAGEAQQIWGTAAASILAGSVFFLLGVPIMAMTRAVKNWAALSLTG